MPVWFFLTDTDLPISIRGYQTASDRLEPSQIALNCGDITRSNKYHVKAEFIWFSSMMIMKTTMRIFFVFDFCFDEWTPGIGVGGVWTKLFLFLVMMPMRIMINTKG